jgi:hypothetical protein
MLEGGVIQGEFGGGVVFIVSGLKSAPADSTPPTDRLRSVTEPPLAVVKCDLTTTRAGPEIAVAVEAVRRLVT